MGNIFNVLESLELTSKETSEVFSESTRDVENLKVFRDSLSEIIYIDDFFVGNEIYNEGLYRLKKTSAPSHDHEDINDCKRRSENFTK